LTSDYQTLSEILAHGLLWLDVLRDYHVAPFDPITSAVSSPSRHDLVWDNGPCPG
jgi:hypothetical protein